MSLSVLSYATSYVEHYQSLFLEWKPCLGGLGYSCTTPKSVATPSWSTHCLHEMKGLQLILVVFFTFFYHNVGRVYMQAHLAGFTVQHDNHQKEWLV